MAAKIERVVERVAEVPMIELEADISDLQHRVDILEKTLLAFFKHKFIAPPEIRSNGDGDIHVTFPGG